MRYAHTPEYMIARRIFKIFKRGTFSNTAFEEIDDIVTAWQEIYHDEELEAERLRYAVSMKDSNSGKNEESEDDLGVAKV